MPNIGTVGEEDLKMNQATEGYLVLKNPPNPDILCRFSALEEDRPLLDLSLLDGTQSISAGEGPPQGDLQGPHRFLWERVFLPPFCTQPPFACDVEQWRLMFHLWRPKEMGVLQARVYLIRQMLDEQERTWEYFMSFDEVVLRTNLEIMGVGPITLNAALAPMRFYTFVHSQAPSFDFDIRLMAGPANVIAVKCGDHQVKGDLSVAKKGVSLLEKTDELRDLSFRCDLAACHSVDRNIERSSDEILDVTAEIDTGPWSGIVRMNEAHGMV